MRLTIVEVHQSVGSQRLRTTVRIKLNGTLEALDRHGSGCLMFLEEFAGWQYQSKNLNVIGSYECFRNDVSDVFVGR
jgi:hypothetical protein